MRPGHLTTESGFRLGYCYLEWFVAPGRYAELVDVAEELGPLPATGVVRRKLEEFFHGNNVLLRAPTRYDVGHSVVYHVDPCTESAFRLRDWFLVQGLVAGDVAVMSSRIGEMVDDVSSWGRSVGRN